MSGKRNSKGAAARVAQNIVTEIRERSLPPGAPLEPEHRMVEQLGASRGAVREALRYLEWQGALTIKTGKGGGPVVAVPDVDDLVGAMSLQLQFANATVRSIAQARSSIYPILAMQAAENREYSDIMALDACWKRLEAAVGNLDLVMQLSCALQEMIGVAAKSPVLGLIVNALHRMSEQVPLNFATEYQATFVQQMRLVLNAIERKDAAEAHMLTARVMKIAADHLELVSPELMGEPISWIVPGR